MNRTLHISVLLLLLKLNGVVLANPAVYRIADVGFLSGREETVAYDLNDSGAVIGISANQSFTWTEQGGIDKVPRLSPRATFTVQAINNLGDVAGKAFYGGSLPDRALAFDSQGHHSFFLDHSWANDLLVESILQVTDLKKILGRSIGAIGSGEANWIWSPQTGAVELFGDAGGFFEVRQMNDHDQVVGFRYQAIDCPGTRAFIYDVPTHTFTVLDHGPPSIRKSLCGRNSSANAINDAGQVVGYSNTRIGLEEGPVHAFIWTAAEGSRPLSGNDDPRMRDTRAEDINEVGQVVGTFKHRGSSKDEFFYWDRDSGVLDLQQMLDPNDPLAADVILQSNGYRPHINSRGQIVLSGHRRGDSNAAGRTFVLTPLAK